MRPDLDKVLTERPRWGIPFSQSENGTRFKHYDEAREDRYSLPKHGKRLMGNRDLGIRSESKDFTDKLGPLTCYSQVGRNWDRVYSEIRQAFPNTNKQNHHLLDTHLLGYVERNAIVEKTKKGRRVYSIKRYAGRRELRRGDMSISETSTLRFKT